MSAALLPDGWGHSMAAPQAWGAELLEWLEAHRPEGRDDTGIAYRALLALRDDLQQVIDELGISMAMHNKELGRAGRLVGDDAMDRADMLARAGENRLIDEGNAALADLDYYAAIVERVRTRDTDEARADRDLPGYDGRMFGWRERENETRISTPSHSLDTPPGD